MLGFALLCLCYCMSAVASDLLLLSHLTSIYSPESDAASALNLDADTVTQSEWRQMSTHDFASYKAIVIGDPAAGVDPEDIQFLADTADVWGPAITGNIIIHGMH